MLVGRNGRRILAQERLPTFVDGLQQQELGVLIWGSKPTPHILRIHSSPEPIV